MEDKVFSKPIVKQFEFDEEVAGVFDDMLNRSVPFYKENLDLIISIAKEFLDENDRVYDLGCSTANLLIELSKYKKLDLIGIDNSTAMIERAKLKSKALGKNITFINSDILDFKMQEAKVIFANYTLQFIRPIKRERLIRDIFNSLVDGGVFIFSEKVISKNKKLNKILIDKYYDFKKLQGYSEFEISQKREALENVLVPYSDDENIELVLKNGFSHCEILFKWVNFSTFIAIK